MRPALVRRCEIWLPTTWGWLALLLISAAIVVLVVRSLYPFLAASQPVGARVLVVEGWMESEGLDQAIAAFRSGRYERVVTTGGPIDWPRLHGPFTFAERAVGYLKQHGLADDAVTDVPAPKTAQDRTYLRAMVREWAQRTGLTLGALDVFSFGTHARRSRLLYRSAFGPNVEVGELAAQPPITMRTRDGGQTPAPEMSSTKRSACFGSSAFFRPHHRIPMRNTGLRPGTKLGSI